jgi:hypothetical protein
MINLDLSEAKRNKIFLDSDPWNRYLPAIWNCLRQDNYETLRFDIREVLSGKDFENKIAIYSALSHAVTYGHIISKPGHVINAHFARKDIGLSPIFSENFEKFWNHLIPAFGLWAIEYADHRIFEREVTSIIHDCSYMKISKEELAYSTICSEGGWDLMHLSIHSSIPLQEEYLPYKKTETKVICEVFFKNYSSWATFLLNEKVSNPKVYAINIDDLGLLGHFLVSKPDLIPLSEREVTPGWIRYLNDQQVKNYFDKNKDVKPVKKRRIPNVNDEFSTILSFFGSFNGYEYAKRNNFDLADKVINWMNYYQTNDRIQPDLTLEDVRAWQFYIARSIRFGSMESYDLYGNGPTSFGAKNWKDPHWVSGWKIWIDLLERCRELAQADEV